jgi:hypothetical protein
LVKVYYYPEVLSIVLIQEYNTYWRGKFETISCATRYNIIVYRNLIDIALDTEQKRGYIIPNDRKLTTFSVLRLTKWGLSAKLLPLRKA